MERDGFTTPLVGTASVKIGVDANGNLIAGSTPATTTGYKRVSINNINAGDISGDLVGTDSIEEVFTAFYVTLSGVSQNEIDMNSTTYSVKWEVA